MPLRERVGFAARAAARNRHAYAAIVIDPQQVAPGAAMSDEIDGCKPCFARCYTIDCACRFGIAERQTELHDRRIPDSVASAHLRRRERALDIQSRRYVSCIAHLRGT